MNVLIIGNSTDLSRFQQRFPATNPVVRGHESEKSCKIAIWFRSSPETDQIDLAELETEHLFIDSTFQDLSEYKQEFPSKKIYGFTSLPSFFERAVFEVSLSESTDRTSLEEIMSAWDTEFEIVSDQPGLVTPRVIGMIINEAFFTAGEGTASKEDIDTAMKLGTNYPKGPFEWANDIGITNVYHLMKSLYESTGESRYKPSPLLEEEGS